jgi:hypothetical protein
MEKVSAVMGKRNVEWQASCTITSRSDSGGTWIRANIRRSYMRNPRQERTRTPPSVLSGPECAHASRRLVIESIQRLEDCGHIKRGQQERGKREMYIVMSEVFGQKQRAGIQQIVSSPSKMERGIQGL